jgi:hypothetical protein
MAEACGCWRLKPGMHESTEVCRPLELRWRPYRPTVLVRTGFTDILSTPNLECDPILRSPRTPVVPGQALLLAWTELVGVPDAYAMTPSLFSMIRDPNTLATAVKAFLTLSPTFPASKVFPRSKSSFASTGRGRSSVCGWSKLIAAI